jgi:hypothetical protein
MPTHSRPKAAFKAIGYTNDHESVFLTQEGEIDGKTLEFTTVWDPKVALMVAKQLTEAARACLNRSPIILPGDGS